METIARHRRKIDRRIPNQQLADVEVVRLAGQSDTALRAEEDVGRGLVHPLAADDALAMVRELARSQVELEHGRLRLLGLEHEWILAVTSGEQKHPRSGSHTPDADDLACHVDKPIRAEEVPPIRIKTPRVVIEQLADELALVTVLVLEQLSKRDEQGRDVAEPRHAVMDLGELAHRAQARLAPRLGEGLREQDATLLAQP